MPNGHVRRSSPAQSRARPELASVGSATHRARVARAGAPAELYRTPSPQTLLPEIARREALASVHGQELVAVGHRNMHLLSGPGLQRDQVFQGYGGGAMSVQFSRSGRHLACACATARLAPTKRCASSSPAA